MWETKSTHGRRRESSWLQSRAMVKRKKNSWKHKSRMWQEATQEVGKGGGERSISSVAIEVGSAGLRF